MRRFREKINNKNRSLLNKRKGDELFFIFQL